MDLKVPAGISFLPAGTMTVRTGLPYLRYLTWLPFCETKMKPKDSRTLMI